MNLKKNNKDGIKQNLIQYPSVKKFKKKYEYVDRRKIAFSNEINEKRKEKNRNKIKEQ